MKTSSGAWIEPRVEAETTNIFDMAALWLPGNFTPPQGRLQRQGTFPTIQPIPKPKGKENYHQKGSGGAQ